MKLQKMCEKVRDAEPGTNEHTAACQELAGYLGVSIWVGQYAGDRVDDDFALIILRALEGREEEDSVEIYVRQHENKLQKLADLKAKS